MYLKEINIWNFRQFGSNNNLDRFPDLNVEFNKGLNLLVGANDSGKSSIIDAMNYLAVPYSYEYQKITSDDFYSDTSEMRIEAIFAGMKLREVKNFIEYILIEDIESEADLDDLLQERLETLSLKIFIEPRIVDGYVPYYDMKAGEKDTSKSFRGEVREYLKSMYLKPLRDAERELTAGRGSRLSEVLRKHKNFGESSPGSHPLSKIFLVANEDLTDFFHKNSSADLPDLIADLTDKISNWEVHQTKENQELLAASIKKVTKKISEDRHNRGIKTYDEIDGHLQNLFSARSQKKAEFNIADPSLANILQKLNLVLQEKKAGLGSLNILFIALELILLQREDHTGLRLGLIEEAEAHLHTQAQMRVLKYLQTISESSEDQVQFIITTHSPQISSQVSAGNIILLNSQKAYSLGEGQTQLDKSDYAFLDRFLDATKANLFFAEGVIIVEGDAENILIPTIAEIIGLDLVSYGVSIVNVGHTGLFRYARILQRSDDDNRLELPVSCIRDNDVIHYDSQGQFLNPKIEAISESISSKQVDNSGQNVKNFVSPNWTLEFDIALDDKLKSDFLRAVLYANKANNAKSEIFMTDLKKSEVNSDISSNWLQANISDADYAYNIYSKAKDVKSLTAQFYAEILSSLPEAKKAELKKHLLSGNSKLNYIVQAIQYATGNS